MLRIGTWNVEYARTLETNKRRREALSAQPADIWVLTETHDDLYPSEEYSAVHAKQRIPLRGPVVESSRWVSVWSRLPIEQVTIDGSDDERTVAALIRTDQGKLIVYGTVMPWRGDDARNGLDAMSQQVADWGELRRRFPGVPLCVAGDFNDDLSPAPAIFHSNAVSNALRSGLVQNNLVCATLGDFAKLIDHIALPQAWMPRSRLGGFWQEFKGGPRLSDHPGVVVEVEMTPLERVPLQILVAGPYRSGTNDDPAKIKANVDAMTETALKLFRAGHLPVMGEWYALPLIELAGSQRIGDEVFNEIFHPISRQLVARCDAVLRIGGASSGADEMVSLGRQNGKAVYFRFEDLPAA